MIELNDPYGKSELVESFEKVHQGVSAYFDSLPLDTFFKRPENAWSPSDNLRHLTKSVRPVTKAMNLPKLVLFFLFGKAKAKSKRFAEMREIYQARLAQGASAGRFAPSLKETPIDAEGYRKQIMQYWADAGDNLIAALAKWNETALDRYQLPHPLLGKFTVREMLFFTLYHDLHHVDNVRKRLEPQADIKHWATNQN